MAREQTLSTRVDITPPCSSPNGWRSSSRISTRTRAWSGSSSSHSVPTSSSKWESSPRGSSAIARTLRAELSLRDPGRSAPRQPRRVGFRPVALSDDQKAMLRLLAQREQGYEDIAALMGISVEEVRERAQGRAGRSSKPKAIPAPAIPAAGAARAGRRPSPKPTRGAAEPEPPARRPPPRRPSRRRHGPAARRRRPRPQAARPRPKLEAARGAAAPARRSPPASRSWSLADRRPRRVGGGDDSGDDDHRPPRRRTPTPRKRVSASARTRKLTQAVLEPVDGSDAKGVAIFGRVKNTLALQVEAEGLEPTEKGESYTIWLSQSPQKMLPLASTAVGEDGKIGAQVEVPTEVLAYLANETFDQIDDHPHRRRDPESRRWPRRRRKRRRRSTPAPTSSAARSPARSSAPPSRAEANQARRRAAACRGS